MSSLTHNRVQTIKRSLGETGKPPVDRRGKHQDRGNKLPPANIDKVHNFVGSLKGRKAQYSLKDGKKKNYNGPYLSSVITEKNIKKRLTPTTEQREPKQLYHAPIKLPMEKFRDLVDLLKMGGIVLDLVVNRFNGFVVFQPIINGIGGNLVSVQASRISTYLHVTKPKQMGFIPPQTRLFASPWLPSAKVARTLILMGIVGQSMFVFTADFIHASKSTISAPFFFTYITVSFVQMYENELWGGPHTSTHLMVLGVYLEESTANVQIDPGNASQSRGKDSVPTITPAAPIPPAGALLPPGSGGVILRAGDAEDVGSIRSLPSRVKDSVPTPTYTAPIQTA
uniref:SLC41A/MgtE integral membrane domain-containing protein n=1 Tax=Timema shepardi TaxID=629360 RepID=A0A7R9FZZ9_TIMSH|nr:unnamed protein product [Timema shepardi]